MTEREKTGHAPIRLVANGAPMIGRTATKTDRVEDAIPARDQTVPKDLAMTVAQLRQTLRRVIQLRNGATITSRQS